MLHGAAAGEKMPPGAFRGDGTERPWKVEGHEQSIHLHECKHVKHWRVAPSHWFIPPTTRSTIQRQLQKAGHPISMVARLAPQAFDRYAMAHHLDPTERLSCTSAGREVSVPASHDNNRRSTRRRSGRNDLDEKSWPLDRSHSQAPR